MSSTTGTHAPKSFTFQIRGSWKRKAVFVALMRPCANEMKCMKATPSHTCDIAAFEFRASVACIQVVQEGHLCNYRTTAKTCRMLECCSICEAFASVSSDSRSCASCPGYRVGLIVPQQFCRRRLSFISLDTTCCN